MGSLGKLASWAPHTVSSCPDAQVALCPVGATVGFGDGWDVLPALWALDLVGIEACIHHAVPCSAKGRFQGPGTLPGHWLCTSRTAGLGHEKAGTRLAWVHHCPNGLPAPGAATPTPGCCDLRPAGPLLRSFRAAHALWGRAQTPRCPDPLPGTLARSRGDLPATGPSLPLDS